MGKSKESNYQLKSTNKHLLNIFEQDYYVELGAVDIEVINSLLEGQIIAFEHLADPVIMAEGSGSFGNAPETEITYQLNYLNSLVEHQSANKLFLSSGVIRYNSTIRQELYAPLLLIPVKLYKNNQKWFLVKTSEPIANELLIQRLNELTIEKMPSADNIRNSFDIDRYCQKVARISGCPFQIDNYLTYAKTEYPDFSFDNVALLDDSSFHEYPVLQIYEHALTKQRPLLPSNVYQKYVMLKAARNESFVVSGKIRSGKTSTIINIIANKIAQNQRVLYVNNDNTEIEQVQEELAKTGLIGYTLNLADPYSKPTSSPIVGDYSLRGLKQDLIKTVNKVLNFDQALDVRYHGFRYREIIEQLLLLNTDSLDQLRLPIGEDLEKFEIDAISQKLLEIEEGLKKTGPFASNIWRAFENYYSASDIKEVIDATKEFQKVQMDIRDEFNAFSTRYHLISARTIKDAHQLIYIFKGFNGNIPPYSWHIKDDFHKALEELSDLKRIKYLYDLRMTEIDRSYTGNIEGIDIDNIYRTLYGPYYTENDAPYIDLILNNLRNLKGLVKRINLNKKLINEALTTLKGSFQVKTVEDYMYPQFIRIHAYLSEHAVNRYWVKNGYENNSEILKEYLEDYQDYQEFVGLEQTISKYLRSSINYDIAYQKLTEDADRLNEKIINAQEIKNDQLNLSTIIGYLKRYLDLDAALAQKQSKYRFERYEDLSRNYLDFKAYYDLFTGDKRDRNFTRKLLSAFLDKSENKQKNALSTLSVFVNLYQENIEYIEQLKEYRLNITTESPSGKLEELYRFCQYFGTIYGLNERYRPLFRKDNVILYGDYGELRKNISDLKEMHQNLSEKDDRYYYLFGEYYRGFKTDCTMIDRLAAYFELFTSVILNPDDLVDLLNRDTLSEIIRQSGALEKLYEKWYACFRRFGKLFRGGKLSFFEESFEENLKIINQYEGSLDQLPDVFTVLTNIVYLRKYGLNDLADGIYNGIYQGRMAAAFLATLLEKYKNVLEKDHEILTQFDQVMASAEDFSILEKTYLKQNMETIMAKHQMAEARKKERFSIMHPEGYNSLIDYFGRDKQLYLCNLDILNSDLNLTQFDCLIIDDAHLENSNKYNRLDERLNQIIIFGDKTFTSSIANNLMQRIKPSSITDLKYRYQRMGDAFNNGLTPNNIYIPRYDEALRIMKIPGLKELADVIVSQYDQSFEKKTNIIFGNNRTRHELYRHLMAKLTAVMKPDAAVKVLRYRINLVDAVHENATFADDVYFLFDDFRSMETDILLRILNNFNQANNRLYMVYAEDIGTEKNLATQKQIEGLMMSNDHPALSARPLFRYLRDELQKAQINADYGFGALDLIIRGTPNLGIIIVGIRQDESRSFIDTYQYYCQTFINYGWDIKIIYAPQMTRNPAEIVKQIIETVNHNAK